MQAGPLRGVRVLEFAGLGPAPFAAMMLADMGAEVVCITGPGRGLRESDPVARGRIALPLDLKTPGGTAAALALASNADLLIEGFRPGVMERLGLGPEVLLGANPRLVYGRMTGWGQDGPLAPRAGHDINYIGLTGALAAIGPAAGPPSPPLNLVGDYGGGALYLVAGLLAALHAAKASGQGQTVDCAIVDGVTSMMSLFVHRAQNGQWSDRREANLLDGGAPFYATYACADGRHMAVGAIEPQFYAEFLRRLADPGLAAIDRDDEANWPLLKARFAALFLTRTRAEWTALFDGSDACVTPILTMAEAQAHPQVAGRGAYVGSIPAPAPAPRFGATPSAARASVPGKLADVLAGWSTA